MSRIALRDTEPTLQQANAQLQIDQASHVAARNACNANKISWQNALCNPDAAEAAINAARQTHQQSAADRHNAKQVYDQSSVAYGDAQDTREARQDYLQALKDKRDPLKQVESFPKACNIDLPTLMAHLIEEWNNVCKDVESGQHYERKVNSKQMHS